MTLQEVANIGEILGAAGVIASLVFVAWQLRTNTKTTRLRMHEQVTQTYMSFLGSVIADPESFAAGLKSTESDFADLSDGRKMFFFGTMLGFFKHFELMFAQHAQGVIDAETWDARSGHIRMYYHEPGAKSWWELGKMTFIPAFRNCLESSVASEMTSFVELASE